MREPVSLQESDTKRIHSMQSTTEQTSCSGQLPSVLNDVRSSRLLTQNTWYLLLLADLFVHEAQVRVAYGYLLFEIFPAMVKFMSEVLLLAGAHRVTSSLLSNRKPHFANLGGEFLIVVLILMALYSFGSLVVNIVLWLQVADPGTIDAIFWRRSRLNTAFCVIQFLLTTICVSEASYFTWTSRRDGKDMMKVRV